MKKQNQIQIVPVEVFDVEEKKEDQKAVVVKPVSSSDIQVRKGYYDGSRPLKELTLSPEDEKALEEKDRTLAYLFILAISVLLMIFSPHISKYVNEVNKDVTVNVERMPYVIGLTEPEARNLLNGYEVKVEKLQLEGFYYEDGLVVNSNVDFGTPMVADQEVVLYVCSRPEAKAKKLEAVKFPEFPVYFHNFIVQKGVLNNGIITLTILNNDKDFDSLFITIEQYNKYGERMNNRTFYYQSLKVKKGDMFTVDFKLTNPNLARIDIARVEIAD